MTLVAPSTAVGIDEPSLIRVQRQPDGPWQEVPASGLEIATAADGLGRTVSVAADGRGAGAVSRIHLRWRRQIAAGVRILGDAWERGYGDLQWRGLHAQRVLPWMALVHTPSCGVTWGVGVLVRPAAFACWTVDPDGFSLWLDLRSGSQAVQLGNRTLAVATVRAIESTDGPFQAHRQLCAALCADPLPVGPLVGCNNWYYAYGKDFDAAAVVGDARLIAELVGDHPVRPFGVVDDGWTPDGVADGRRASGGPWTTSRAASFPDMAEVAAAIAAEGVRPGIWMRSLLYREPPADGPIQPWEGGYALDPSHPATLELVARDVRQMRDWGFELIKHDFSTFEVLRRWGFQMGARPAGDGLIPADLTRTTAEVMVDYYRALKEAAGDAFVLGCAVIGHLAAGLVEAQRVGDDTSGRTWERTRKMGVNSLAFRLAQHRTFFAVDADCVASTHATAWSFNRQFLDLIARSGTSLFVSVDPTTRTDAVDNDLASALRLALDGGIPGGVEPLDWLDTTSPQSWRAGDTTVTYHWFETAGADPYARNDEGEFTD